MQSRKKRTYEHKKSIKLNDYRNAPFSLMLDFNYTFNFSQATFIKPIHGKKSYRLLESAVISKTNHIKQLAGFNQISPYSADIILHENYQNREWIKKI